MPELEFTPAGVTVDGVPQNDRRALPGFVKLTADGRDAFLRAADIVSVIGLHDGAHVCLRGEADPYSVDQAAVQVAAEIEDAETW